MISGVAAMPDGGFLIADSDNARVLRVWPDGHISTAAGNGRLGFSGDGGPATGARLSAQGVAVMKDGGFLIADIDNDRVRRVWPDGHISTVAGNGDYRPSGDGGPATAAGLGDPIGVAVLADGSFVVGDVLGGGVRRVWPDGHISTAALGDFNPEGLAGLSDGGFLIADSEFGLVRRVWPDGHLSTVAGTGFGVVFSGDGGPATAAVVGQPRGVSAMPDGGFVIAAFGDRPAAPNDLPVNPYYYPTSELRRVWPDGHISTIAGKAVTRCHSGMGASREPPASGTQAGSRCYPTGAF